MPDQRGCGYRYDLGWARVTVIARLEVAPSEECSLTEEITTAVAVLDEFDISYEPTPTDTGIECESVEEEPGKPPENVTG